MAIDFDTSELRALSADLTKAGTQIDGKVLPVLKMGAGKIKAQMRQEMAASKHFGQAAPTIGYDIHGGDFFGVGVIEAEIGPDKTMVSGNAGQDRYGNIGPATPGGIANLAYFGGSRGGGTVADPVGALNAEAPRFEAALLKILGDIL